MKMGKRSEVSDKWNFGRILILKNQKNFGYLLNLRTYSKSLFQANLRIYPLKRTRAYFFMLSYMYKNIFDLNEVRLFYCGFDTNIRDKIHRR